MHPRSSFLRALLVFSVLPLLAHGANAPLASEQDFLGDLPVVLSISRLAQPQSEAPGSVTVIDSDRIRLSGARELADVFRLVPGFQVGYSGSSPEVFYHGAWEQFGQHLQVLVDGRSVYSPFSLGGVNWNNIPLALEDIERIEVLRGSNSATYGSDSFLGVINIISKHPSQTPGWTFSQRGGQGVRDTFLRYGGSSGQLDWRLSLARRADQGFDTNPSARHGQQFNLRANWRAGLRDEFEVQAGGNETWHGAGYPNDVGCSNPPCNPSNMLTTVKDSSAFVQAKWRRTLAPDQEFQLSYHHTHERLRDNFPYGDPIAPGITIDHGGTSSRDDVEAQHTFSPRRDMRVVWGAEWRQDRVHSWPLYATTDTLRTDLFRLFGNLEWRITPKAVLNLGNSTERSSLTGTSHSPRVMLNYHLTPEQTLRIGTTRATRAPSIFEEKANLGFYPDGALIRQQYLATGNFQPETIISREIGWLGDFPRVGVTADVRLFHEEIQGLAAPQQYLSPISLSPTASIWLANYLIRYYNLPSSTPLAAVLPFVNSIVGVGPNNAPTDFANLDNPSVRGIEWQVEFKPRPGTRILLNQSFMRVAATYYGTNAAPKNSEVLPTHGTSLALFQQLPGETELSVMLYSVGAMRWPAQVDSKLIPGYCRVDARVSHDFRLGKAKGRAGLTVQNLGTSYYETDTYFLFDRRVMADLSITY